jgi:hypothetical protein
MNSRLLSCALVPLGVIAFATIAVAQTDMPPAPPSPTAQPGDVPPPPPPGGTSEMPPAAPPPPPAAMPSPPPSGMAPPATIEVAPTLPVPPKPSPQPPLKIETPTGSIKFGLLAQPQYEALGSAAVTGYSQNIYLRRIRIIVGGTLFKDIEYFFETDFPNMFKADINGIKNPAGLNIQDAFVTYKPLADFSPPLTDMLKIDAGYMLPPMSHNAVQGAATLFGWDYFSNTFRHSDVFGTTAGTSPVGRDLGAELRGLVVGGHLEYRAGLFQGRRSPQNPIPPLPMGTALREVQSRNSFRVTGRVQINLLDPEPGFFYAGTYLGAKRILSVGGSYDYQHIDNSSYDYWDVDGFLDMPLGPGTATAQVDFAHWNGGTLVALPNQKAIMGEAGYTFAPVRFSPIFRFEKRWLTGGDETRYAGGLAFWPHGHNTNLKAFYSRVQPGVGRDFNQINVQWQVYFF